jgi:hypothetical protein
MARAPGTRAARRGAHPQRLETLAAEFALLAQRRARLKHKLDLLDRQHQAASHTYLLLEARMALLSRHMGVGHAAVPPASPPPAVAAPPAPVRPAAPPPPPPQAPTLPPARGSVRRRRREPVLDY